MAALRPGEASPPLDAVLETADRRLEEGEAAALVRSLFGVDGACVRLSGERDQNFRIAASDGHAYVLKVSHSAEGAAVSDLQTQALLHIARCDPGFPTPRLVPAADGDPQPRWTPPEGGAARTVRLLTLLPGRPLHEVEATPAVLRRIGAALARLHAALAAFRHPAERHALMWDLQHLERSRALLDCVEDPRRRALAREAMDRFAAHAAPVLDGLGAQFIHNDLNPHNLLIDGDGEVSGVLDLGDAVRGPAVNDVAVAAAYHLRSGADPLAGAAAVVAGYRDGGGLAREAAALLPVLIGGRLAMTVAITAWRARLYPGNRDYILRNAPGAAAGLESLLAMPLAEAQKRLSEGAEGAA